MSEDRSYGYFQINFGPTGLFDDPTIPTVDGSNYTSGGQVPLFPKAKVNMGYFMATDAMFHMMLEVVAQLEMAGATPEQVKQYREEAINGSPYAVTPKWVSTKGASNG